MSLSFLTKIKIKIHVVILGFTSAALNEPKEAGDRSWAIGLFDYGPLNEFGSITDKCRMQVRAHALFKNMSEAKTSIKFYIYLFIYLRYIK